MEKSITRPFDAALFRVEVNYLICLWRDCVGVKNKKAGIFNDSSFCETALHLENIVHSYKNLHCLNNQDEEKTKSNLITILIINRKKSFARIFSEIFQFFSDFF